MVRDYNAAVTALNTLQSNFSIVDAIRKSGRGMNKNAIPEMIEWCRRIGYEPSDFDKLNPIHIAGTKGKGSTSSFVSSILSEYLPSRASINAERVPTSVGLYTSPHLRSVRERIQINNQPISEPLFAKYFFDVWDRLEASAAREGRENPGASDTKPVYFRFLTLMALHCFIEERVGTAVLECGIGGEYDSTNILVRPSVTGVTSLGIDHTAMLGDTIESIAWHKAGIFKTEAPAFTAPQPASALETLRERAKERQVDLLVVEPYPELDGIKLGLQGDFQKLNASLAIAIAAAHLQKLGFSGLPLPSTSSLSLPDNFLQGLQSVQLGGRCEMRKDTKNTKLTWFIDGGHTLESIEMAGKWFAQTITAEKSVSPQNAFRILIFNQQTRDASSLARKLHDTLASATGDTRPFQHAIFCTNTTYKDAGYKADLVSINTNKDDIDNLKVQKELASVWDEVDHDAVVHVLGTIEEAVAKARELAGESSAEVLVTGSLHLVGGLIEVLESENESTA
ncbi:FolC bifunctional protein [Polychaeton citri CBS 116435]|uniref:Folylpolyglutamate synthase n=1 Tax=Polychaeton citri CBS 116435 TaxID=1314669 RepID=A0A9P4UN02_9PEZI|nr:FolC bifunctional protein [Polychaeton citri CBS 116435]